MLRYVCRFYIYRITKLVSDMIIILCLFADICTLFSHQRLNYNIIERIENLDCCKELRYLDISSNSITKIENLSSLQHLETLIIKQNQLSKPDSIRNVIHMKRLRELDMSSNKINCSPEGILEILSQCKALRILSLKGNAIAKSNKHYRKMVVSRCKKLTKLDGVDICKEERRRCNSWGAVVTNGGSFDEADEASRQELNNILSEKSEANVLRRSAHGVAAHGSDDGSTNIGSTVMEGIKKAFGLVDTSRQPSSNISWSGGTSRRNIDLSYDGGDDALKQELDYLSGIVESQRQEISHLKEQLGKKQSQQSSTKEVAGNNSSIQDILSSDSEFDTSYSTKQNQEIAEKASLGVVRDMQQSIQGFFVGTSSMQQQNSNRSSSMVVNGEYDPFSIMPPLPPPRHSSM